MAITEGDTLPDATLLTMGEDGPEPVRLADRTAGRTVVIFGLPGAFTRTCTAAHLPSFMRTGAGFADKGVAEILCVAVNDPFVMKAWGEATGAADAGIAMLADPASELTRALGLEFSAPALGFRDRCQRFAMVVEDGRVRTLHLEQGPGTCEATAGEALLATLA